MALPTQPVTLSPEQISALNDKLSTMRHDINNNLAVITAAAELVRCKPDAAERMMATLLEHPARISENIKKFSVEFDRIMGVERY